MQARRCATSALRLPTTKRYAILELVVRDAWRASEIIKRIRAMASRAAPNKAPVDSTKPSPG